MTRGSDLHRSHAYLRNQVGSGSPGHRRAGPRRRSYRRGCRIHCRINSRDHLRHAYLRHAHSGRDPNMLFTCGAQQWPPTRPVERVDLRMSSRKCINCTQQRARGGGGRFVSTAAPAHPASDAGCACRMNSRESLEESTHREGSLFTCACIARCHAAVSSSLSVVPPSSSSASSSSVAARSVGA